MKDNRLELLQYCLSYEKPLSDDFIRAFCGFKTIGALHAYARNYDVSLARFNRRIENKPQLKIEALKMLKQGKVRKQIAHELEISLQTLYKLLKND